MSGRVRVRLILADRGEFLTQETTIPQERLEEYDRRRYGSVMLIFYMTAEDLTAVDEQDDEWDGDERWEDNDAADDEA